MRGGNKSVNIGNEIEKLIKSGELAPGDKLPAEIDMALQYDVSSGTIRKVLQALSAKGLVERTRKKGSFIKPRKSSVPITFLLPCPNFLCRHFFTALKARDILDGAMKEAASHGVRIETVAVSSNNDPEQIDWALLDHLNNESMVIVFGVWYHRIFPFLLERNCRSALFYNVARSEYFKPVENSDWNFFIQDHNRDSVVAMEFLRNEKHCRSVVYVGPEAREESHPFVQGYKDSIERKDHLIFTDNMEFKKYCRSSGQKPDGILFGTVWSNQEKNDSAVYGFFRNDSDMPAGSGPFGALSYDFHQMGIDMARSLISGEKRGRYNYPATIIDASSEFYRRRLSQQEQVRELEIAELP